MGTLLSQLWRLLVASALKIIGVCLSQDAMVWLAHYLLGSGRNRALPSRYAKEVVAVTLGLPEGKRKARLFSGMLNRMVGTATVWRSNGTAYLEDRYDWHPNALGQWAGTTDYIQLPIPFPVSFKLRLRATKEHSMDNHIEVERGWRMGVIIHISDSYWVDRGTPFVTHMSTPID